MRIDDYPALGAIVVFETQRQRDKALRILKHFEREHTKKKYPRKFLFKGVHKLSVAPIANPTHLNWLNYEVTAFYKILRFVIVAVPVLLFWGITYVGLILVQSASTFSQFYDFVAIAQTLVILITNKLIEIYLVRAAEWIRTFTLTGKDLCLFYLLYVALTCNTMVPLAIFAINWTTIQGN